MALLDDALYHRILKPILFRLDAERSHQLTLALLATFLGRRTPPNDPPELAVTTLGTTFSNPIGLAAGMDKDIRAAAAWQALGFGFVEFGTITPRPQTGNPRPRLWRLVEHRALINRLGFPSAGMEMAARRLERARRRAARIRIGLNFGPNKDTAPDRVAENYAVLVARLGAMADFIVVNVSSPNTPGLREWQSPSRLTPLLNPIMSAAARLDPRRPVLVKLAPDLDTATLASICEALATVGVDGIVACNTTMARETVGVSIALEGGLSGTPLRERACAMVTEIRRRTQGAMPIVGVGGVASAADAWALIRAGATLVELYTGLVYEGPGAVERIKAGLVGLLRREGMRSIREAVGTGIKM
jgi:dihydroorotate dehydrogenase